MLWRVALLSDNPITIADLDAAPSTLVEGVDREITASLEQLTERFEEVTAANARLEDENSKLRAAYRANEILDSLIEPFAIRTFAFMCVYCGFVGVMIWFNALDVLLRPISDDVMQILVGSTAVTVIGLVGMVLTGIFVGARKKRS